MTKINSRRTNLTILDDELWKWAKVRTIQLDFRNVSEYIFNLIEEDKHKTSDLEKDNLRS